MSLVEKLQALFFVIPSRSLSVSFLPNQQTSIKPGEQQLINWSIYHMIKSMVFLFPKPLNDTNELCCRHPQTSAVCGISRIWTAASVRKQGIASKLLETAR